MRKSDAFSAAHGVSGRELMFRAGKSVFDAVCWRAPVAIVCGVGNNAGDGFVVARLLRDTGVDCCIFLIEERFSKDGAYYFGACRDAGIPIRLFDSSTDLHGFRTVVDCIFGTGFSGSVGGNAKDAILAINSSGAFVVSVDINSGLNADNGLAELCVLSDLTVSIGRFKTGHFLNMAKDVMKEKINCDIGVSPVDPPCRLIRREDLLPLFKKRPNYSHKGTYGYSALIGGSRKYAGAVRLAEMANAAMRSGAGVVKLAFPNVLYPLVAGSVLESTLFPLHDNGEELVFCQKQAEQLLSGVRTAAFGMGVGVSNGARAFLEFLLDRFSGTLIVDADGLSLLSSVGLDKLRRPGRLTVLTPHMGEFSRLTGKTVDQLLRDPVGEAVRFAARYGVLLLLKGPATIVTDGINTDLVDAGCPGMATAGSGDVLSGILCAVLSFAPDPLLGCAAAAYINGKAGELAQQHFGSVAMVASDTASFVRQVVSDLEGVGSSRSL